MGDGLIRVRPHRTRVPLPVRLAWRYLITGRELAGPGDNATFLHDATEDYRGRPYEKLTRARWRRLARRWGVLLSLYMVAHSWLIYGPWAATATISAPILTIAVSGAAALARWWPDRRLQREYVRPAAQVLCRLTGARYRRRDAARLVELPPRFGSGDDTGDDEPAAVRVLMPGVFALPDPLKQRIVTAVGATLGLPGARGEWREAGSRPYVDIYPAPAPPRVAVFRDIRRAMEAAPATQPVVGIGPGRKVVSISLEQDSPHVGISGGAGTGKSSLLRVILPQMMRNGDGVIVCDRKRWSHRWLHNMPENRVRYLYRIADIHDALVATGEEMERRINADEEELPTFRRVHVVCEEGNSLAISLARYWKAERQKIMENAKMLRDMEADYDPADLNPPQQSPAVAAMQEGVFMGRELGMHWWVAAQKLSAGIFGGRGGDVRESFQIRFIAKWDRSLWKMLVNGLKYVACPSGPRGIWGCQFGEEFTIFRVPFLTDAEARSWALGGVAARGPVLGRQAGAPVLEDRDAPVIAAPVTLTEAVQRGLPSRRGGRSITLGALRRASSRSGFPAPLPGPDGALQERDGAHLYDWEQLLDWAVGGNPTVPAQITG